MKLSTNTDRATPERSRYYTNFLCKGSNVQSDEEIKDVLKSYYDVEIIKINPSFERKITNFLKPLMSMLQENVETYLNSEHGDDNHRVESIYSGMAGIAVLFNFHALKTQNQLNTKEKAKLIIEKCLLKLHTTSNRVSYLTGESGVYVTAATIYKTHMDFVNVNNMIKKVTDLLPRVLDEDYSDELLYGRAGYLYSLLLLKRVGWKDPQRDKLIRQIVSAILNSGMYFCVKENIKKTPIMYEWHLKKYLGAAHGLSGILHCLLLANEYLTKKELDDLIKPALNYLLSFRFESGNIQSSINNDNDRLVQWCHGAAGVALTFALAYKVFQDNQYLLAAEKFGEVVWSRGLLTKGYGLCHGVSGNTYTFLALYQITKNSKYLYRTAKFMEWCLSTDRQNRNPDRPLSLFEGITGVIYMLLDAQNPLEAEFIGF
ncbi:glutathione S-transferase LANCL1-like [Adelges cooleyi]|uniref:glutathione S-transferase LANCL1-like n=1 Tax=Adelges cooleyi TaxID=133065 RepID=UPI00218008FD|nr:glutathione S-transferase LANCL1-like [Adelges cooleyi]